jgi:LmbE family N-acetylglucosaminyl deacetylase
MTERKAEDKRAALHARTQSAYLELLEVQYRGRDYAVSDVARAIASAVSGQRTRLVSPIGIGDHPDHLLVRDASLRLRADGAEVAFYAELPYAARYGWPSWVTRESPGPYLDIDAYWEPHLLKIGHQGSVTCSAHLLSPDEQRKKVAAVKEYRTQFTALNGGPLEVLTHPLIVPHEVTFQVARV